MACGKMRLPRAEAPFGSALARLAMTGSYSGGYGNDLRPCGGRGKTFDVINALARDLSAAISRGPRYPSRSASRPRFDGR